jgi:hypothetical protein
LDKGIAKDVVKSTLDQVGAKKQLSEADLEGLFNEVDTDGKGALSKG